MCHTKTLSKLNLITLGTFSKYIDIQKIIFNVIIDKMNHEVNCH